MAGRLTRFLNLEKPRRPGEAPAHEVATKGRFTDEAPPVAAPDDLFRAQREAQLRSGIELETESPAEQPFLRCPVCEADNSKYAARCINCQARLDSDEARAWNARLWQERRKAQEAGAQPQLDAESLLAQNRALGEALAREVGERERARLSWLGTGDGTPAGMRLLGLIQSPGARFATVIALVATFFGSAIVAYTAKGHPALQVGGLVVAMALLALFTPNRRRRWRWWDWD